MEEVIERRMKMAIMLLVLASLLFVRNVIGEESGLGEDPYMEAGNTLRLLFYIREALQSNLHVRSLYLSDHFSKIRNFFQSNHLS